MKKLKPFIIPMCSLILTFTCHAQDIIAVAGDYSSNSVASLSWTLGEPIVETYSNSSFSLTQGFQQSRYTITGSVKVYKPSENIIVFPNPLSTSATITIEGGIKIHNANFVLYDLLGKEVKSLTGISENTITIERGGLSAGVYLYKLMNQTSIYSGKLAIE